MNLDRYEGTALQDDAAESLGADDAGLSDEALDRVPGTGGRLASGPFVCLEEVGRTSR
jgi:hypothetical protein